VPPLSAAEVRRGLSLDAWEPLPILSWY